MDSQNDDYAGDSNQTVVERDSVEELLAM